MSSLLCKVIEVGPTDSALSYGGGVDLIDFFVGGYDVDKIKQNIFYDFFFFFFLFLSNAFMVYHDWIIDKTQRELSSSK